MSVVPAGTSFLLVNSYVEYQAAYAGAYKCKWYMTWVTRFFFDTSSLIPHEALSHQVHWILPWFRVVPVFVWDNRMARCTALRQRPEFASWSWASLSRSSECVVANIYKQSQYLSAMQENSAQCLLLHQQLPPLWVARVLIYQDARIRQFHRTKQRARCWQTQYQPKVRAFPCIDQESLPFWSYLELNPACLHIVDRLPLATLF